MREEYTSLYKGPQIDMAVGTFISGNLATKTQLDLKVDKVTGKGLSEQDFTTADKILLDSLGAGAVASVNGQTGVVVLDKTDIGLNAVDNTSDLAKPVSTATQTALNLKVDVVAGKQLSQEDFTTVLKNKLDSLGAGSVTSVNTRTGDVVLTSADVGLGNATNTSDANKPVSTAQQAALDLKVDIVAGKQLSDENYTLVEKNKLAGIEALAEVNNISDANATDLTDAGDSALHFHSADRARANHTGTQLASTISDFSSAVSNNSAVFRLR